MPLRKQNGTGPQTTPTTGEGSSSANSSRQLALRQGAVPFALTHLSHRAATVPSKLRKKRAIPDLRESAAEPVSMDMDVRGARNHVSRPALTSSPAPHHRPVSLLKDERYVAGFCLLPFSTPPPASKLAKPGLRSPVFDVAELRGEPKRSVSFSEETTEVIPSRRRGPVSEPDSDQIVTSRLKRPRVNLDSKRSWDRRLELSTRLAQARNRLQAETIELRLSLKDAEAQRDAEQQPLLTSLDNAVAQRDLAVERLQELQKEHRIAEATLTGLWTLVETFNPELPKVSTLHEIHDEVLRLARVAAQVRLSRPPAAQSSKSSERIVNLERQLAQSRVFLAHTERMEAAEHMRAEKATDECELLRAQVDTLQAKLVSTEAKLARTRKRQVVVYSKQD